MRNKIKYSILWYLLICYAVSITLNLSIGTLNHRENFVNHLILYIPAVTAISLLLSRGRTPAVYMKELGLSLKAWEYWILTPVIITALCMLGYGISVMFSPGLLQNKEDIISTLNESGFFFGRISLSFTVISLINALLGSLVSIPVFLGQELGWRAFLIPRLLLIHKPGTTFLIGGLVWGLWSFLFSDPFFSGIYHPVTGCFLTILCCIPLGIIFQYVYFKSQSIFIAALAHGAFYRSFETAYVILSPEKISAQAFGPLGIPGMALFWAVALILYKKMNWQLKNIYHEKTP